MAVGPKGPKKHTTQEGLDTLVKPFRPDWELEHNPDEDAWRAYDELWTYLEDRGKLVSRGKGDKLGRKESFGESMNRPRRIQPNERLDTLLKGELKGRWPVHPADPQLERKLFNQNQDYKKPLPYDY